MKVLVTGATGLLGANVVRELLRREEEVRVLIRPASDNRALDGLPVERVTGDILDLTSLESAVEGCDAVIHAAANTGQWPTHYRFYEAVNVTGTQNLINVCRRHDIPRVVYVSTVNTIGSGTREHPATELSEFNAFRYNSGYMISKYVAQQWVLGEVEKYRLPVVVVNPAFMIGPYDYKPSSGTMIMMGLGKKVIVYPPGGKSYIHVRDAAVAVCNALTMGIPGECYILATEHLTYREFFAMLDRAAGQKSVKIPIPCPVLWVAGLGGSVWAAISGQPAPLNLVNARVLCLNSYYSGEKAREILQMPHTPVEQAIAEAIRWFRRYAGEPGQGFHRGG